ncbi:MAG: hypothetical protein ACKO96_05080 [Flammeovirgaceae bacterium]
MTTEEFQNVNTEDMLAAIDAGFAGLEEPQQTQEQEEDGLQHEETNEDASTETTEEEVTEEEQGQEYEEEPAPKGARAKKEYAARKATEKENQELRERLARLEERQSINEKNADKVKKMFEPTQSEEEQIDGYLRQIGKNPDDFSSQQEKILTLQLEAQAIQQRELEYNQTKYATTNELNGVVDYWKSQGNAENAEIVKQSYNMAMDIKAHDYLLDGRAANEREAYDMAERELIHRAQNAVKTGKYKTVTEAICAFGAIALQNNVKTSLPKEQKESKINIKNIGASQQVAGKTSLPNAPTKANNAGKDPFAEIRALYD